MKKIKIQYGRIVEEPNDTPENEVTDGEYVIMTEAELEEMAEDVWGQEMIKDESDLEVVLRMDEEYRVNFPGAIELNGICRGGKPIEKIPYLLDDKVIFRQGKYLLIRFLSEEEKERENFEISYGGSHPL